MARIIGGSPLGFLSGKLGGHVYSHNKGGQYIRQYVIPVNPNSNAQLTARAVFGCASSSYHSLTPSQKTNWNSFAADVFSPKKGTNNGQFSGFNAYTSLKSVCEAGNSNCRAGDMTANNGALGTPAVFNPFDFSADPPVYSAEGSIGEQVTGKALSLALSNAWVYEDGKFKVKVDIDGAPSGGSDITDFEDSHDHEFGFLVNISNPNPQRGMHFSNPTFQSLGYIQHPTWDAADLLGVEYFSFESTNNIYLPNYQSFPSVGNRVLVSLYVANENGCIICIGSVEKSITASP